MAQKLRILHLEDNFGDAELIDSAITAEWPQCEIFQVKNGDAFRSALETKGFDLVLSDFSLPQYNGLAALRFVLEHHSEVPFILISGTLGEEQAVESLKQGATDYVLKQRLTRLVPAIRRALSEAEERQQRVRAEQQVRRQAAYLDEARAAIHVRDSQGIIRYWNKGAERIYGWTESEAMGRAADELLSNMDHPALVAPGQVAAQGEWTGELNRVTKANTSVIVESRWTLLSENETGLHSTLVIDTDITERKNLEAQFLRAQRLETIGALAGGIAHDLNNILAPIIMVADVIREELPAESRSLLDTARASAERGAGLVKQILSFARGVAGQHQVLQIPEVVAEIVKMARDTFPRSIKVETFFESGLYHVKGDRTQMQQVLMNLFVNARDAMAKGGSLRVEVRNLMLEQKETQMQTMTASGPHVLIKVADTGEGIPAHLVSKIYQPFFTTKAMGKGTGLGLSTVLSIIKTHNGFVEVESESEKGTTFFVYLPACGVTHIPGTELAGSPQSTKGESEPVRMVEDEAARSRNVAGSDPTRQLPRLDPHRWS